MSHIEYGAEGPIGVITLNRPEKANAQTPQFVRDLHDAWMAAAADDEVRVIVVRANGRHFSSGHDLRMTADDLPPWKDGISSWYAFEDEAFVGYTRKWRDLPKPSIAAVQGACIAGGLMLCWPCDLIIAADDAKFGDPVAPLGVGAGVEYHGHTWELGARKAKEMLFTGGSIAADEAHGRHGEPRRPARRARRRGDELAARSRRWTRSRCAWPSARSTRRRTCRGSRGRAGGVRPALGRARERVRDPRLPGRARPERRLHLGRRHGGGEPRGRVPDPAHRGRLTCRSWARRGAGPRRRRSRCATSGRRSAGPSSTRC